MSAELMKPKFVRLSVCIAIISIPNAWIPSNLGCCFPCAIRSGVCWTFTFILRIFFVTLDPMGAKISKRYSCYKSQPKFCKILFIFLQWSSQNCVWDCCDFEKWNFNYFIALLDYTQVEYGVDRVSRLLLFSNQTFSKIPCYKPHKSYL